MKNSKGVGPVVECNSCKEHLQSSYSGELVECKCYKSSYEKINDVRDAIIDIINNNDQYMRHKIGCILHASFGTGLAIDSTEWKSSKGTSGYTRFIGSGDYTMIEGDETW